MLERNVGLHFEGGGLLGELEAQPALGLGRLRTERLLEGGTAQRLLSSQG